MFEGWDGYFVLLGTAAGGLIGLLFVVASLTGNIERSRALWAAGIYMTPIAVHFAFVLSISAITQVPRLSPPQTAVLIGGFALLGLSAAVRSCLGITETRKGPNPPHWSDFWGYGAAPAAIYVLALGLAAAIAARAEWAVQALAALLLILLLLAIRNAWDLITWMAPGGTPPPPAPPGSKPG
jgi:hypothetical protein